MLGDVALMLKTPFEKPKRNSCKKCICNQLHSLKRPAPHTRARSLSLQARLNYLDRVNQLAECLTKKESTSSIFGWESADHLVTAIWFQFQTKKERDEKFKGIFRSECE